MKRAFYSRLFCVGLLAILPTSARADDPGGPAVAGAEAPPVPAELRHGWQALGPEARWQRYVEHVGEESGRRRSWIPFLVEARDWGTLEWIALYDQWRPAAEALARAQAPPWMRVAVWGCWAKSSHSFESAATTVMRMHPGVALAYLERHREVIEGPVAQAHRKLRQQHRPAHEESAAALLPPLDPQTVFRHLHAPPQLAEQVGDEGRGPRPSALLAQVLRALSGLQLTTRRPPGTGEALRLLLQHPSERVRFEVCLAIAGERPERVPHAELAYRFHAENESARVRDAALLAFSTYSHPAVLVELQEVALAPAHPAWSAAVSRLAEETDYAFRLRLEALLPTLAQEDKARFLRGQLQAMERAERALEADDQKTLVHSLLERAAWLRRVGHPRQAEYGRRTLELIRSWRSAPQVAARLQELAERYEPSQEHLQAFRPELPWAAGPAPEELQSEVRALAAQAAH